MKSLLLLFLSGIVTQAATYYVDFATGSDANNGTSTSTPFKRCPGDANATGTAAATSLSAGSTVIFKGGVSYTGLVKVNWSGAAGSVITYDGNSAGTWGSGKAIIDQKHTIGLKSCIQATSSRSYVTIKNFTMQNVGGYYPVPPPNGCSSPIDSPAQSANGGAEFDAGGSYITVSNCDFNQIGEWHNTDPFGANAISGACVWFVDVSHLLIDNCDFTKSMIGAAVKAETSNITDIEIRNSSFHNYLAWSIDISPRAAGRTLDDIRIHDSRFFNYLEYSSGLWTGCGPVAHVDNIFLRVDYDNTTWTRTKVYNNYFYVDNPVGNGGTACIHMAQMGGADIYNNVFNATVHPAIYVHGGPRVGGSAQVNNIYNNTFYLGSTAVLISSQDGQAPIGPLRIQNNIFQNVNSGWGFAIYQDDADANPTALDYNLYKFPGAGHDLMYRPQGILKFSAFNAAGYEAHGMEADPLYVSTSGGITTPSNNNLQLQASSPAIGRGLNLNSFFTVDKLGAVRGSTWDIGAYEFGGVIPPPPPPQPVPTCTLVASPSSIQVGQSAVLTWTTANATTLTLNGVNLSPISGGAIVVVPTTTTSYNIVVNGIGGSTTCSASVTVTIPPPPPVNYPPTPTGLKLIP